MIMPATEYRKPDCPRPGDIIISREHHTGNASVVMVSEIDGRSFVTVQVAPGDRFTAPSSEFSTDGRSRYRFEAWFHSHGPDSVCTGLANVS